MASMFQDPMSSRLGPSGLFHADGTYPEFPVESRLRDGERYGWWTTHQPGKEKRRIVTVHGAVNDMRTRILLHTGASLSMISLVLAREHKLKLNRQNQVKITASTEVKITLGSRVAHIRGLWVTNIGEGLDVLLGMYFMFRAGVRVCVREGLVQLPDEESIPMYNDPRALTCQLRLQKICISCPENTRSPVSTYESRTRSHLGWTWVVYQARPWPVAIKVVNVSKHSVWIDMKTPLARIVQYGSFPQVGRFVRPGTRDYREWQTLILEHVRSEQDRLRAERKE
ncbi:hypothetical protein PHMEG_0003152 [Phytophthora megakarya]|uniref:Peptidase A2 domain-containing protein n=1 Tax=Phytophthora megakarya TaxID=4795 RepID=A0A225WWW2_9STRA|nr:hypothetical protein PHMEG_0003152 [Phytophthora megakarya]